MKNSKIAITALSVLYGLGLAASVDAAPSNKTSANGVIQQVDLTTIKKRNHTVPNSLNRIKTMPGARNQLINNASAKSKFAQVEPHDGKRAYIIQLKDQPIATYTGNIKGLPATARSTIANELTAKQGNVKRTRSNSPVANAKTIDQIQQTRTQAYKTYLTSKKQLVLNNVRAKGGDDKVRADYFSSLNGMSLNLTYNEALNLAEMKEVKLVQPSRMLQLHTDTGPQFIGADKVWAGQTSTDVGYKGEGIIVGIIDTGINSDHVAFADIGGDGYDHTNPLGTGVYLGDCADGTVQCNDKLIGVYSWPVITDTYGDLAPATGEDYQGHGSHTAGTAAGNYVENVPLLSASLGDGDGVEKGYTFASTSGVAPHANIISYQACELAGCPEEALVLALEQAIEDGVDVINFSIGGGEPFPWEDATELAMLAAREAGISIAVSAGNAGGDDNNTYFASLSHSAPWSMVVAASTHDRVIDVNNSILTLSGGLNVPWIDVNPDADWPDGIAGYSTTGIENGTPVVAMDYGDELCLNPFAEGTFTSDQIVICKRGENARVSKAYNVMAGGAGGFILYNDLYNWEGTEQELGLIDDTFPLPGLHVGRSTGESIISWINDGGEDHKMSISAGSVDVFQDDSAADILAGFSSLGPSTTFKHHMSPNISAPGVNILAPYADEHPLNPDSALSQDWTVISGTSMASPHVAGAMALVRQANPDWTAAEVQSALQMTSQNTVRRNVEPDIAPEGLPATVHRAGSGRIDVAAAVKAGLIMDETVENFELANPVEGGDVRQLNLPQLMDSNCRGGVCSWLRTVTATEDGTWTITEGDWVYDRWTSLYEGEINIQNAKMEFYPSTFTLKAGESQSIIVKADIKDVQYQYDTRLTGSGDYEGLELWNNVYLTSSNATTPDSHWPVSINFDRKGMPENVNVTVNRDQGAYHVANLPMPVTSDIAYLGHGPVKADVTEITLPQDNNHKPIYSGPSTDWEGNEVLSTEHYKVDLIDIPENTARFVVEVLGHEAGPGVQGNVGNVNGSLAIHIGIDTDGNGLPDFDNEWVCSSTTQIELNYCSLTKPNAGQYWVVYSNTSANMYDWAVEDIEFFEEWYGFSPDLLKDTYSIATAVVPMDQNNLSVTGPAANTEAKIGLDLSWDLDDLVEGDVAYGAFEIGSNNVSNAYGFVPLRLERGPDDVTITNKNRARGGETLDVSVHVVPNNTGMDRDIDLSLSLPEGVTLVEGSLNVNYPELAPGLVMDGNVIRLTGTQPDSSNWARSYKVTTSVEDELCQVPNYGSNDRGFVGLYENYGFTPEVGGSSIDWAGSWNDDWTEFSNQFELPLSQFWGEDGHINLFNNESYRKYSNLYLSPQGFVSFDNAWSGSQHAVSQPFPYLMNPYAPFIGVLWKGQTLPGAGFNQVIEALSTPLNIDYGDPSKMSGMMVAYAIDEASEQDDIIIEWLNSRSESIEASWFGENIVPDSERDDRYTFNLILHNGNRFGAGQFEIIMAYGGLDYADVGDYGSVGLHGNYGPIDIFGFPFGEEIGVNYAYNDLSSKLQENMAVCYDYTGPEASQFDVSFQVRVSELAAGKALDIELQSHVSGMGDVSIMSPVEVVGNLTVPQMNDLEVDENGSVDLLVAYVDSDINPNVISVEGEHISAVVHGHQIGSKVTITPEANWYGETEVMVKVADSSNPTDMGYSTFMLTVVSDGVAHVLGCMDSTATNYDAEATESNDSCQYAVAKQEKDSKGGSMAFLSLLLVPLLMFRRRTK